MRPTAWLALCAGLLVVVGAATGAAVTAQTTGVVVDATPTDTDEAESTHTVVFTVGAGAESVGGNFDSIRVDYSQETPSADVSNVGAGTIERIGVDRGGDDIGTRIDETATINEVTGGADGNAILIQTNGALGLNENDEVVVVLRPVQNPQNEGTPSAEVTLNTQGAAEAATDAVTYEATSASVSLPNQRTDGSIVTVDSATLSEGGWVVVLDEGGRNADAVRGQTYLSAGSHSDVEVSLDEPVSSDTELAAQVHHDTNGDRLFDYSGGNVDRPYENADGNIQASDTGQMTVDDDGNGGGGGGDDTPTPTPTATATQTPTPTTTPTPTATPTPPTTPTGDGDGSGSTTETQSDGGDDGSETATDDGGTTTDGNGTATTDGDDDDGSGGGGTGADSPGFGAVVAATALLLAALAARRRG
jgi:PGF-CTERM protein